MSHPGILVHLDWSEVHLACTVGVLRQISALQKKREGGHGRDRDRTFQDHIEGAAGEIAVAKHTGLFWSGTIGRIDADDVGPYQVRATSHVNGRLVLHPEDNSEKLFISATGVAFPLVTLSGWAWASEGKKDEYWQDPKGNNRYAYWVPNAILHPMSELPPADTLPWKDRPRRS
jgi:hypothetical protein